MQRAAQAAGLRSSIVGVDASSGMLEQARAKQWPAGVRFEMGQAEKIAWSRYELGPLTIPSTEPSRRTCSATSLIGMQCSPGSSTCSPTVACWSFRSTRLPGPGRWVQAMWSAVCWLVIIPLGWLTSRRTRLYRYLWRSVRSFDSIQTFVDRLYGAGFVDVQVRDRARAGSAGSCTTSGRVSLRPLHDHQAA